ncbi:cilia- and flagella-associated protein 61-like [Actinia tenebrosa]|uniref:Cilia- and flagella-associated protein 61-like n=1 Tax=Actinia tenebrosa TaxID=6105 RepID=A0A6P8I3W3_ACTTE|nr:cilia- and flagella-associated protein 61-like [Actinia tenebrosa]
MSGAEVIQARRTESLDAPEILKLVSGGTEKLFGRVNVVNIIEKANLAVTLVNAKNDVIAFAAFFDYPNIPSINQAKWEEWLKEKYDCTKANALNSLFLNFFVAKPDFALGCASEIIRTVFNAVPFLHYLFLVMPRGADCGPGLFEIFNSMRYNPDFKGNLNFEVKICHRHEHCPKLHIRHARVEDHDDLMPTFNRQNDVLTSMYGNFFLAEMIEAQDEDNRCLVADVDGTAVGFMSVCSQVDCQILNRCFDLGPFNGLKKLVDGDDTGSMNEEMVKEEKVVKDIPEQKEERKSSTDSGKSSKETKDDEILEEEESQSFVPKLSDEHMRQGYDSESDSDSARKTSVYQGIESAFCIQLFCIDEKYEMRSLDFLPAAFAQFPDRDYCILTMPHLVSEFPLLQSFTRVTPKRHSTLSQELYVYHRWGLIESFSVKPCTTSDTDGIKNVVKSLKGSNRIMTDIEQYIASRRDHDGTQLQAFVAESMGQIVGVAILRREEDIEYIRSHYSIEDFVYFNHHQREEHAHLHHFVLNPIFQQYSKHFLKEVLRLSHKSCLYYPIFPRYSTLEGIKPHSTVTALNDLVTIKARRQIIYPVEQLGGNAPSDRILQPKEPFALNHLNRKLTLEPKVAINARIVVVGASDVGISFLETFVFCPHLRFNNLTLITPQGLPGQSAPDPQVNQFLPSSLCFTDDDHAHMSLRTWINVVKEKMTRIDRTNKIVYVTNDHKVPYDYLVLCTGQQFQIPVPSGADISTLVTTSEVERPRDTVYRGTLPGNVFAINSLQDSAHIVKWLKDQFLASDGKAVVYGWAMEAYTTIQGLLSLGVPASRIVMVQPPPPIPSCFNNLDIDEAIENSLKTLGVEIHIGFTLAQWNDSNLDGPLTCATFTSDNKPLRVECQAFFCFQEKRVDYQAFKAINDSCLVFDGKLVVNANFHTNDPFIRAAGPLTKYQRRYHAESWTHANYNSKEIGSELAHSMLVLFDPTLEGFSPEPVSMEDDQLVPIYKQAKMYSALLPGGYHYLHVGKPGLNLPLDSLMVQPEYGRELVTGSAKHDESSPGYFRLHVNQYRSIETITCLSKQPIDTSNLLCLYGLHERYLNNLLQRFDEDLITNFYSFFRESWCLAIFHDRFNDFREEVRELLVSKPEQDAHSLEEKVRKMIDEDLVLTKEQRRNLRDAYIASPVRKAIELRQLSFLSYNSYHLPMYVKQGVV